VASHKSAQNPQKARCQSDWVGRWIAGPAELNEKLSVENLELEELVVSPRRSDIDIDDFSICWLSWRIDASGISGPAW